MTDPRRPRGGPSAEDTGDLSRPTELSLEAPADDSPSSIFERLDVVSSSRPEPTPRDGARRRPLYRADPDRVLRVLSANQFEDPFMAFRELYANSLDAVRGRSEPRIEIKVASDRVIVSDNGAGLSDGGLEALTTLGMSTRRGRDAIGRFGIGFASIFDPQLGVHRVEFHADRPGYEDGVLVRFRPDVGGGVSIRVEDTPGPRGGGSRVEVHFDPARAPDARVARAVDIFETHAAYSGVETDLNGRPLGRSLSDYIRSEISAGDWTPVERALVSASAVKGAVGVAAIDPLRSESKFRAYQHGLFVCEVPLARVHGKPWPRGIFGAASAEGLELVASRNAFVEDERYDRFLEELRRLAYEAAYRVVRYWEQSDEAYARVVLLDALRRGLRSGTPQSLLVESDDLFSKAAVRSPIFAAWGQKRRHSFAELVELEQLGQFRASSYRPARQARNAGLVFRADDSIERAIFRKLSGMREMPAAARAEEVASPRFWSRLRDRLMSGPQAEYSLFQRSVEPRDVPVGTRALIEALEELMGTEEVSEGLARLLPGPLPRIGYGCSRNAFGPVAAYRMGEIRFNTAHRAVKRLSRHESPSLGARALLPVLAHELAHMCHELHDLDFYRTSRAILRVLAVSVAKVDARELAPEMPTMGVDMFSNEPV